MASGSGTTLHGAQCSLSSLSLSLSLFLSLSLSLSLALSRLSLSLSLGHISFLHGISLCVLYALQDLLVLQIL